MSHTASSPTNCCLRVLSAPISGWVSTVADSIDQTVDGSPMLKSLPVAWFGRRHEEGRALRHALLHGSSLWFGSYGSAAKLSRLDLQTRQITALGVPELNDDAVAYLAQNPAKPQEWAMATFKRDVYLSPDAGTTWRAIAKAGQPQE